MKTFTYLWYKTCLTRLSLTFLFCVSLLTSVFANTFTITNLNDSGLGSFREAITNALATGQGPHIINATITGTIYLQSPLPVIQNVNLTINGPSGLLTITRGASTFFRILTIDTINGATTLVLNHLNLTNGNSTSSSTNRGGIILVTSATLVVNRSFISNGTSAYGGAICAQGNGVNITIFATSISGNQSIDGGAIYLNGNTGVGTMNLTKTTIAGNSASGSGGAIFIENAITTFTSCTISSNTAGKPGAGIFASFGTNLQLNNSTISKNRNLGPVATSYGAGINSVDASNTFTLMSTLVVGNLLSNNSPNDIRWEPIDAINKSANYSVVGVLIGQDFNTSNFSQIGTSAAPKIVSLGPLAYNGGPTPTHCLLSTSPELAIDQGNAADLTLLTDQRNITRVIDDPSVKNANGGDGSDIGAFESEYISLPLKLVSLTGKIVNKNHAELIWISSDERNFDRFEIEWSTDGINWIKIGESAAVGNTGTNNYSYIHKQLSSFNYYRLKMVDQDAKFMYSQTIQIRLSSDQPFRIFPNPAKNNVTISFPGTKLTIINFFNIEGQAVLKKIISTETNIDISHLPPGVYTVEIIQDVKMPTQKLLKR